MADKNAPKGDKKAGRPPKKDTKSSKNTDSTAAATDDETVKYCPCNVHVSDEISVSCDDCGKYWHLCCVGLSGLTEECVGKLTKWSCPDCFFSPHCKKFLGAGISKSSVGSDCGTVRVILKEKLNTIQPVIAATVADAVRRTLSSGTVCSKEDVETVVKTYAEATKQSQKKVIEETTQAQTAHSVVEKVVRKLDADKVEREKRRENVVVMNAPESEMESAGQKKADDLKFCYEKLGMSESDIQTCWRAGKLDASKPDYCRPLVIKMSDEENANDWTKNGRGNKTQSGFWINRDLCDADRKANFVARQEKRVRHRKISKNFLH